MSFIILPIGEQIFVEVAEFPKGHRTKMIKIEHVERRNHLKGYSRKFAKFMVIASRKGAGLEFLFTSTIYVLVQALQNFRSNRFLVFHLLSLIECCIALYTDIPGVRSTTPFD